jgi:hypothetical protein
MHKQPLSLAQLRKVPKQFSWVDQRLVREHYIDGLSHSACALYLFVLTVADAQGLSYYAESTLCRRLSMTQATPCDRPVKSSSHDTCWPTDVRFTKS